MADWHQARISKTKKEAHGLTTLELNVGDTPLRGTHLLPGQYVKVALEGKGEAYFALASRPAKDGDRFEILVKQGSSLADALSQSAVGQTLTVSLPAGRGFPVETAHGKKVLLFATGSGISPIRSVIEEIRADRSAFDDVVLYFGARTPDAFAYADELHRWEKDRIRVIRTVSQPGQSGWTGLTGYVQNHLSDVDPRAIAFVCGQKAMVQNVIDSLVKRGLPKENIFLNF